MKNLALALLLLGSAADADPAVVVLDGQVTRSLTLTRDEIAALPASDIDISFQTGHGPETAHYKGALLWTLIERAGLADAAAPRRASVRHTLWVTGQDGYQVVLALAEIDPAFEGKAALLAYERDGQPLPPRLLVPGDLHGGRAVNNVVHLDVR